MSSEEIILLYAALKQMAKGLELQRSGILAAAAILQKHIDKGDKDGRKESITVYPQEQSRKNTG